MQRIGMYGLVMGWVQILLFRVGLSSLTGFGLKKMLKDARFALSVDFSKFLVYRFQALRCYIQNIFHVYLSRVFWVNPHPSLIWTCIFISWTKQFIWIWTFFWIMSGSIVKKVYLMWENSKIETRGPATFYFAASSKKLA